MTVAPIAKGMGRDEFSAYVKGTLSKKMGVWRPAGMCLHNTAAPTLAQFYVDSYHGNKPMSGEQRVKNSWQRYIQAGWAGGPHLIVTDREILLANPLWMPGTHSPSFNATFWGCELGGDYDKEKMPEELRLNAVHAIAELYAMLGHVPSDSSFKFHKEDLRSTHRGCPGKNVGSKQSWIDAIADHMASETPGDCACGHHDDPTGALAKKAKPKSAA